MAREIGGIVGVLDGLVSGPAPGKREQKLELGQQQRAPKVPNPSPRFERQKARLGRLPGRKNGQGPLKEKTSIWVSASVIAEYRDHSWKERRSLGELIELALIEYRRRHFGKESQPTGSPDNMDGR